MWAAPARGSERVLRHVYPQSDHGAASEVDDSVDRDHFQVQLYVPRPFDGTCHHQGGTDGARLLKYHLLREDFYFPQSDVVPVTLCQDILYADSAQEGKYS